MNFTDAKLTETNLKELTNFLHAPHFTNARIKPFLVFCILFIALLSFLSNTLIIHVIRVNQHMHTTINYLIMNMACGDLLVTLVSSMNNINRLYNGMAWAKGAFGNMSCKAKYYAIFAAMFCSVFSLVAITFDRFMAVVRPYSHKHFSRWSKYTLPVVWLASLGVPSVLVFRKFSVVQFHEIQDDKSYCVPLKSVNEGALMTICGYGVPHVVMVIMYTMIAYKLWIRRLPGEQLPDTQQRQLVQQTAKRVTLMIIFVLLVFEICWGPMFALNVIPCLIPHFRKIHDPVITAIVAMAMCSNGVFNALIYFSFCGHFRHAIKATMRISSKLSLRRCKKESKINPRTSSHLQMNPPLDKQDAGQGSVAGQ
ncbi:tachykinin-like peptides receptor 99D [Actinia tenebrosa]|uniref:Tachykinin-like peptides receptor 99D n=1 Tax=Actinia tenebrosa TaxID=6105 RepID=A0A6P8I203_ACTTE|nr:tachykinin-like peptides receptor 99D [Actinia tenebrosa]XP_031558915.1 tachykinin-like peptides receptor 99D [Actinia tenebrosa]XP_031558916.1 tachykinin-like peptides receptor 99D [Actinia tenebrosa]XP_031558917.1 tachykinin-like peptides receptor 99D [Actinia tenebrosa]